MGSCHFPLQKARRLLHFKTEMPLITFMTSSSSTVSNSSTLGTRCLLLYIEPLAHAILRPLPLLLPLAGTILHPGHLPFMVYSYTSLSYCSDTSSSAWPLLIPTPPPAQRPSPSLPFHLAFLSSFSMSWTLYFSCSSFVSPPEYKLHKGGDFCSCCVITPTLKIVPGTG